MTEQANWRDWYNPLIQRYQFLCKLHRWHTQPRLHIPANSRYLAVYLYKWNAVKRDNSLCIQHLMWAWHGLSDSYQLSKTLPHTLKRSIHQAKISLYTYLYSCICFTLQKHNKMGIWSAQMWQHVDIFLWSHVEPMRFFDDISRIQC